MGFTMARNLLAAGLPLAVHNRTRAKAEPLAAGGAAVAASAAEAAERARIVITMLADDQAIEKLARRSRCEGRAGPPHAAPDAQPSPPRLAGLPSERLRRSRLGS